MDPSRNDDVAVHLGETLAEFIVNPDQPSLAYDGLGAGDDAIESLVLSPGWYATLIKSGNPLFLRGFVFKFETEFP